MEELDYKELYEKLLIKFTKLKKERDRKHNLMYDIMELLHSQGFKERKGRR